MKGRPCGTIPVSAAAKRGDVFIELLSSKEAVKTAALFKDD
jgi:hypothetical protein